MANYFPLMAQTTFFNTFTTDEIKTALHCLQGKVSVYPQKSYLYRAEEQINRIGIILEGAIYLSKNSEQGERQLFDERIAGELFGENCLWSQEEKNGFDVIAAENCTILFIEREKILHPEKTTCPLRQRIIENLFQLLLVNNRTLYQKITVVAQKNIRTQLLFYLRLQARKNNAAQFFIPFSRQELADYLGVDRSALSRELMKMKQERMIDYRKNYFVLLQNR